ncbi:zinc finger protein 711-like [Macrobrachium nipponense]|uniref:zinc finger protein 711-like n=1 Tax=Macrobrachium nipponense TaxID=159736 RepID=UPI0030C7B684
MVLLLEPPYILQRWAASHQQESISGGGSSSSSSSRSGTVLTCPNCPKTFSGPGRQQLYERHVIVHTGARPFNCPHCTYRANQLSNLRRHIKSIHLPGQPQSNDSRVHPFLNPSVRQGLIPASGEVGNHVVTQSVISPGHTTSSRDVEMQPSFLSATDAASSDSHHHHFDRSSYEGASAGAGNSQRQCYISEEEDLAEKEILNVEEAESVAVLCVFPQGLAVQVRLGDVASLVCPMCGKAFSGRNRRQILERHIATHTGHKPFTCGHCPFRSSRQDTLKTHIARMHREHITVAAFSGGGGTGAGDASLSQAHRESNSVLRISGIRTMREMVTFDHSQLLQNTSLQQRETSALSSSLENQSVTADPSQDSPTL